eukprot:gene16633-18324_t
MNVSGVKVYRYTKVRSVPTSYFMFCVERAVRDGLCVSEVLNTEEASDEWSSKECRELRTIYHEMVEELKQDVRDTGEAGLAFVHGMLRRVTPSQSNDEKPAGWPDRAWGTGWKPPVTDGTVCIPACASSQSPPCCAGAFPALSQRPPCCAVAFPVRHFPAHSSSIALSLLEEWRGVRDAELSKVSGIEGCIFVHASGFIGGNATYEGALAMARATLAKRN